MPSALITAVQRAAAQARLPWDPLPRVAHALGLPTEHLRVALKAEDPGDYEASKARKRQKAGKAGGNKPSAKRRARKQGFQFKYKAGPDDDPHLTQQRAEMAAKVRRKADFKAEELAELQAKLEKWVRERK